MPELKTGARLKSSVCDGEIMVVATPGGDIDITCGGAPMLLPGDEAAAAEINPEHAVGIVIGKRYITADEALEVLCVKAGQGSLAVNGELLLQKDTKKLPKTD
ncbi:MAG: hypothetical protein NXH95_11000 [Pseudomonadaceae bacterium]|nr:hypothetical protein [Pseudomonadaceae bacterium]